MDTAVTFLLENLKQLLMYHVNLISSAEGELKRLQDELDLMKSALEDASKKHKKEEVFKTWEKQIREVVYQVEDIIDVCITQKAADQTYWSKDLGTSRLSLANKVKAVREGPVKEVFDQAKNYFANLPIAAADAIQTITVEPTDQWRKEPRKSHIVGLEDETEKVIKYLKEKSDGLEVISIVGMPGLGKTTLAWKIFQDPDIQFEFPVRIWLTVSAELNTKDLFLRILEHFTKQENMYRKSAEELAEMVTEKLKVGKFLIIMDDVWTRGAWDQIKKSMPMDNGMGRILITTRNEDVACRANPSRQSHEVRFLTDKESWELLQYEVYGKLNVVDKDLVQVGNIIAVHCDGLPLSIIVIAGILVDKMSTSRGSTPLIKKEWHKVSESVQEYLIYEDKEQRMSKIIALSYTKLPYDLRDCFLYFGMFPEDAEIPASELTLLWIAEGFIQQKMPHKSLEEIALDNLKDLISRNLVMVEKTRADGEVKTCRVHDMIRGFCQNEGANEQKLFQEIKLSEGVFEPKVENISTYRRLCIHSYVCDFFTKKPKIQSRSFLCFPKESINLEITEIALVINAFSLIRVFDAGKMKFPKFPPKLARLVHLRYLTLSLAMELKSLPDAIFNLWNLQTLIVNTMSRTLEIKADIWKMMQLRHLKTKASITLSAKEGKGQGGDNLKTVSSLTPESCTDAVFTKARNLQSLGVHGNLHMLLESNCLATMERLNKLKLEHNVHPRSTNENPLRSLPQSHRFPMKLKILTLKCTYLTWPQMSILGNISSLEVLKLKDHAFMGNSWNFVGGGFHNLEFLYIERTDLMIWTVVDHSFDKLRSLVLKNCEVLQEVPMELGKNLEMLSLERVTKSVVSSAITIEETKQEEGTDKKFKLVIAAADRISK